MDDFISHFRRNPDGSWTCVQLVTFDGPNGRIQVPEGRILAVGTTYMGVDLAGWLDEQLRKITDMRH